MKSGALTALLGRVATERVPKAQRLNVMKQLIVIDRHGRLSSMALAELQWSPSINALRFVNDYLKSERISESAATTAVAIASALNRGDSDQRKFVHQVLQQVTATTKVDATSAAAKALLK